MSETLLATLSSIRTVEEMSVVSGMKNIAGDCWKPWCGRMVGSARPVVTSGRSRLPVAIRASGCAAWSLSMLQWRLPVPV